VHPDRQYLLPPRNRSCCYSRLYLGYGYLHSCLDQYLRQGRHLEIVVGNSITRDRGQPQDIQDNEQPGWATLPASFNVTYDCGTGYTGSVNVSSGSFQTVSGIPTGSICSLLEIAPAAIPGYTWGTVTYTPASINISAKDGTFEIVVGNSITRDRGNLKISKTTSNPDGATLPASFNVTYDCGTGYTGSVNVSSGSFQTVSGIRPAVSAPSSKSLLLLFPAIPGVRLPTLLPRSISPPRTAPSR